MAFYVSSPQAPTKNLKRPQRLMTKGKSVAQNLFQPRHPGYQPVPRLWQLSCYIAHNRTWLKARLFVLQIWIRADKSVCQKTGETNCFRTQVGKFFFFKKCLISQKGNTKGFDILSHTHTQLPKSKWQKKMKPELRMHNSCCPRAINMSFSLMFLISKV